MQHQIPKLSLHQLFLGLALILFFSFPVGDADLGWHLRYGEALVSQGHLIRDNQFSWLMPDYQWANHSWGFDAILALLFNGHRFWLLSLSAGILISISMLLRLPKTITPSHLLSIAVVLFFNSQLLNIGLRSQLLSLLFTVILLNQLEKITQNIKSHQILSWKLLAPIPILFLLWANLHGQFILGLVLLFVWCLSVFARSKKSQFRLIALFLSSLAITFANPFGSKLWQTTFDHLNAPELKYIYEWMPWEFNTPRMISFLITIAAVWFVLLKHKPKSTPLLPLAALTVLAITSRRIIPYWLIIFIPYITEAFNYFLQKIKINLPLSLTIIGLITLNLYAFYHFNQYQITRQTWDTYCQTQIMCSEPATRWLRQNPPRGPLLNAYRLGGYLTYRLPEIKPMIDGRMTIWQDDQGNSAFLTYAQMIYGQSGGRETLYRLNPEYVLIQPYYPLYKILVNQEGWPTIYQDSFVVVLQNPSYQTTPKPTTN
jgi:hypothetical protein